MQVDFLKLFHSTIKIKILLTKVNIVTSPIFIQCILGAVNAGKAINNYSFQRPVL